MDHITRRDNNMAYISDEHVVEQMTECRRILQKFNFFFSLFPRGRLVIRKANIVGTL